MRTTVFARRPRETGGYGIPADLVQKVLAQAGRGRSRADATAAAPALGEEIERRVRLAERRDDVDAGRQLA